MNPSPTPQYQLQNNRCASHSDVRNVVNEVHRAEDQINNIQNQNNVASQLNSFNNSMQLQRDVKQSEVENVLATTNTSAQIQRDVKESQVAGVLSSQQNGSDTRDAIYRSERLVVDADNRNTNEVLAQTSVIASAVQKGQTDILVGGLQNQIENQKAFHKLDAHQLKDSRKARLEAERLHSQTQRQISENALRSQFELLQMKTELKEQSANHYGKLKFNAEKNKASIEKKVDDICCCVNMNTDEKVNGLHRQITQNNEEALKQKIQQLEFQLYEHKHHSHKEHH